MDMGGFTMPGEAGYEKLTLELAKKWGADVIRDSDGTQLSPEIIKAGYGIYSTTCVIRNHNEWLKENPDKQQQVLLVTEPRTAVKEQVDISLMRDFFEEQFSVNDCVEAMRYWQVYDRTTGQLLSASMWSYNKYAGTVSVKAIPWHKYTVSFLAYRIWEEISMYNHTTNNWGKEHLMQLDPVYPESQEYLCNWMRAWCEKHPATTVVRFTSLFYNFVWIWGSSEKKRNIFTDWGSYDFTVSPRMLDLFEEKYGYALTAEDFVNQGKFHVTHMPASVKQLDWMELINDVVISLGKDLVDIVHLYGKKAYVFYDDSWIGLEPYGERFHEFGFDGLIKCVFSGYEARLCAGVDVDVHELRLHPYLFPVGLGGAPTFMEGGEPTRDTKLYWRNVRRALVREPIQRIGLGGYLHLTQNFPDFCDYIAEVADEFRQIQSLHETGKPWTLLTKVAVLHRWGKLRSWTLSGHFHETYMHELIHINEALSGLPVDVDFIDFQTVKTGDLSQYKVIINAGFAGSAWSGGDIWNEAVVIEQLTKWVYEGGCFVGIGEPSAVLGNDTYFRMAHVLGVDEDTGARVCHGRWHYIITEEENDLRVSADLVDFPANNKIYLTGEDTEVLKEVNGNPVFTKHLFGKGMGIYMSGFSYNSQSTALLLNLILEAGQEKDADFISNNCNVECAFYPNSAKLVIINNSGDKQTAKIPCNGELFKFVLEPYEMIVRKL
ncbi:MAG: 1,3-beta-galactosyl-N-acetylhexosamine phosphorylase [Blautia sp.]